MTKNDRKIEDTLEGVFRLSLMLKKSLHFTLGAFVPVGIYSFKATVIIFRVFHYKLGAPVAFLNNLSLKTLEGVFVWQ